MKSSRQKNPHEAVTHAAASILLVIALGLLVWAFFEEILTDDQRSLANVFYDVVLSTEGFLLGGLLVEVKSNLSTHVKVTIRAVGGSAGLILALLFPLFTSHGQLAPKFTILSPPSYKIVGQTVGVSGVTPYFKRHHYIIVTAAAGGHTIQKEQVKIAQSGEFSGQALIGNATVGEGLQYQIRILATRATLQPGALVPVPPDAVFSDVVTVTRAASGNGS